MVMITCARSVGQCISVAVTLRDTSSKIMTRGVTFAHTVEFLLRATRTFKPTRGSMKCPHANAAQSQSEKTTYLVTWPLVDRRPKLSISVKIVDTQHQGLLVYNLVIFQEVGY